MDRTTTPEAPFEAMQRWLRIERRQTAAELSAFDTFIDRLREVPTGHVASPSGPSALTERPSGGGLASVRKAYRSTVMDVPHYDEEYGNDFSEDVTEEFGSTIATILERGGTLDAQTKRTLLALAVDSRSRRVTLLDIIDAERESIETVAERLRPVAEELDTIADVEFMAESFGSLDAHRARLDTLVERCDAAAESRQRDLREHRTTAALSEGVAAVPLYLYQGFDSTFPILSFIAALGDRIEGIRSDISHAASHYEADRDSYFAGDTDTRGRTES
ncbi:hypothetical protein KY092_09740 [Natronomonas gomsonensis]|uniref:DUF7260 family protein n=1 Tax=Natronomonas gomsonensis TaxID=1046043 RepID=UPI0020CA9888|nr:hypothetical protein [Natronomonas gomsonensis]MCY4730838.1 hypothetical protein [Natronomonas gomsonensis]